MDQLANECQPVAFPEYSIGLLKPSRRRPAIAMNRKIVLNLLLSTSALLVAILLVVVGSIPEVPPVIGHVLLGLLPALAYVLVIRSTLTAR